MEHLNFDFVVVGGGLSGLCAAMAAARHGCKTALIHARPMLGGNASSEIRMHICGADYHATRPYARETGIIEELQLEHKRLNPTNNYPIFDTVLWDKATRCPNLSLYLNACVDSVSAKDGRIESVSAYQQTTEKRLVFHAPLFADATGDGTLGALAGADYTVGREGRDTYAEPHAPETADSFTMGNSLMFQARDAGKPVPFIKPDWANTYSEKDLRNRVHTDLTSGYWWIELGGGKYNTIADAEILRDELLKAVYGMWDHIKNGGNHGAENMQLEWVGILPGKRESRRLLGDYVLTENDCVCGRRFDDAVAYGGWPMDVHTVEGFLNDSDEPTLYIPLKDVYTIPYRCFYSRNIENLFLCGRIISASHMAFASARVMATCAVGGQAVGTAAAIAAREGLSPRAVGNLHMQKLQQTLLKDDCYIPGIRNEDSLDFARSATVEANAFLPGHEASALQSGITRQVDGESNCWSAKLSDNPQVIFTLQKPARLREIICTFDSNLSREITISINERVLSGQSISTPPELLKGLRISLLKDGETVLEQKLEGISQRHIKVVLDQPTECDSLRLDHFQTHGIDEVRLFEVRLYE